MWVAQRVSQMVWGGPSHSTVAKTASDTSRSSTPTLATTTAPATDADADADAPTSDGEELGIEELVAARLFDTEDPAALCADEALQQAFAARLPPDALMQQGGEAADTTMFRRLRKRRLRDERNQWQASRRTPASGEHDINRWLYPSSRRNNKEDDDDDDDEASARLPPLEEHVDLVQALRAIDAYDAALRTLGDGALDAAKLPSLAADDEALLVKVFDHIMDRLCDADVRLRYGGRGGRGRGNNLRYGDDVPAYFANVQSQTVHRRKVLSVAGMRNLIGEGRTIYEQLSQKLFASNPGEYCGNVGINRMRRVTGNIVDLDTCVLRPSDSATMKAINAINEKAGKPAWDCHTEFSYSDDALDIAEEAAKTLLAGFRKDFKLGEEEAQQRNVAESQLSRPVPVANHNEDRGKWPLWHYDNVGVDSFHANVPNMPDVNGALLLAPVHCARAYIRVHTLANGKAAAEADGESREVVLEQYLQRFFEDCVVDSCFNMKWKAIEEFNCQLSHEGTVVHMLQCTQATHQTLFSAIMDDDDDNYTKEKRQLFELLRGHTAFSTKEDKVREITQDDVNAWIDDPAVVL